MIKTDHFFIVWNHGFKYIEEILDIIRNHPNIKIQRIFRKKIDNLDKFINYIYKLDKVSFEHIQSKTAYLKNIGKEIYIIFVLDNNTKYEYKDKLKFSYNETYLKWYIRLMFNPKTVDKHINITEQLINSGIESSINWPSCITHQHVIHSSDIPEETLLIKEYFNLSKETFDLIGNKYLYTKKNIKEILITDIVCNIVGKQNINITDSPHYKYLWGNYKYEYNKYILDNLGLAITYDNLSGSYDNLIKNFDYGKIIENEPSYIICIYLPNIKKYLILDGLHRCSILLKNKYNKIKVYVI